ncbi:patatin-like phospholipase family protein [Chthonobacter rhizosphaerae]|uniref:patatin-like phospholipase family protein n=1 Tax=Chthonobacter rhizosphaerae TaxID=2735553 RepID=UPI001FE3F554|nr:patatin-like phospholipase family protein [Chthonobacter rhizosphaerae]
MMFDAVSRFWIRTPRLAGAAATVLTPDEPAIDDPAPFRPRVGLALGGGSARGWAHIGVLHALAEAGIEVDAVAGTSIGAVVGGCWLSGHLADLEVFARQITKRRMLSLMDVSLSGHGLIGGRRLGTLLTQHLGPIRAEDLTKDFTAVATELGTGHEIWLSSGPLVDAIRASYALPGLFTPVRVGGRWLVDGALVNPVPVSVSRAQGARLVIAVNLGADTFGKGAVIHHHLPPGPIDHLPDMAEPQARARTSFLRTLVGGDVDGLPGIPGVMMEAFNIIQDRITRARLAGDPPDVTIGPKLGRIGLFEFHRAAEAIDAGYEATVHKVAEIRDLVHALA